MGAYLKGGHQLSNKGTSIGMSKNSGSQGTQTEMLDS